MQLSVWSYQTLNLTSDWKKEGIHLKWTSQWDPAWKDSRRAFLFAIESRRERGRYLQTSTQKWEQCIKYLSLSLSESIHPFTPSPTLCLSLHRHLDAKTHILFSFPKYEKKSTSPIPINMNCKSVTFDTYMIPGSENIKFPSIQALHIFVTRVLNKLLFRNSYAFKLLRMAWCSIDRKAISSRWWMR